MGHETAGFNLADGGLHKLAELAALLVRDGRFQVLDLRQMLAHKYDERDLADTADPGIANRLGVEREKAFGSFLVATRGRFPIDQARLAIDLPDGIDVSNEFVSLRECSCGFQLKVLLRRLMRTRSSCTNL
jgi:hypothetical protein